MSFRTKAICLRAITLAIAIWWAAAAGAAPAVVLVVRHAEKEALPADDPPLTPAGKQRSAELVRVVQSWSSAGAPLRELFVSEVKRTQQTLQPLAAASGLALSVVNAKDTATLVKRILAIDGGIVVVAGHSNTVPALIEALGGPAGIVIADSEFDRLFAVTGAGAQARVVALRYGER
jgi:phosphohistidine phosphatase SixA